MSNAALIALGPARDLRGQAFRARLERHLSAVESGRPGDGKVHQALLQKHAEVSERLSARHMPSYQRYMGLMASAPYSHAARIAHQMSGLMKSFEDMAQARVDAEGAQ